MSRNPSERTVTATRPTGDSTAGSKAEALRTMGWSELDQTDEWPQNFIVRPDEPSLGPPAGVELPVLTTLADGSQQDVWQDSQSLTEPAHSFQPTVFGTRLRRADDAGDDDGSLYADPDSAPASLSKRRSAFTNWSFLWLVLLLLLGLAAAAWLALPYLRQGG